MSFTVRTAQLLFVIPLGALQLVAAIVFGIADGVHGGAYFVAVWAPTMAIACITVALRFHRGEPRMLRAALMLLAAQTAFSLVKLAVYHESASFVFLALTASAAGLLALPSSRRHFAL